MSSFREAAIQLRRPFTPQAIKFKVQAQYPKASPTSGLIVAYIDARLVVERLNLILPDLWFDTYEPLGASHLICRLTVDGITRQDIGAGDGKGLYSDALKRAAVKFGIGVSLYAIPRFVLGAAARQGVPALDVKGPENKKRLEIGPEADTWLRDRYEDWLAMKGIQAFGDALDHGDVADSVGALLDETPPALEDVGHVQAPVDDEEGRELLRALDEAMGAREMPQAQRTALRNSVQHDPDAIRAAIARLAGEEATTA